MWYHVAGIQDAAWCYPDPAPGRENLKNHITFATGKGIAVREHSGAKHDSAAHKFQAPRSRPTAVAGLRPTTAASAPKPMGLREDSDAPQVPLCFDPAGCSSRFLRLTSPSAVTCHANCGQAAQGTAFLTPAVRTGDVVSLQIRCTNKPGRMRYFVGCAPERFDPDAGQAVIQAASYSLENLKASPNRPGNPCGGTAPPCFHTSSVITMRVDLRSSPGTVSWEVDTTNVTHSVSVDPKEKVLHPFVSLYNREALFELVVCDATQARHAP